MRHAIQKMTLLSRFARLILPAACAAVLMASTAPARAQDVTQVPFQAAYDGQFAMTTASDGTIEVDGRTFGDATILPGSTGFFTHFIDPSNPTAINNGSFLLFGSDNGSVYGTYEGQQSAPDDAGMVTIAGTYTVLGGWQQLTEAAGTGTFTGILNTNTGEMTISLQGMLTPPAVPTPG